MTPVEYVQSRSRQLLAIQAIVGMVIALIAQLLKIAPFMAVVVGVVIALVPSGVFCWRCARFAGAQHARQFVRQFYWAEALKVGLTAVLFSLVWIFIPTIHPLGVMVGFVGAQSGYWLALYAVNNQGKNDE